MNNDLISRTQAIDALVKAIRKDPYYDSNEAINGLCVCDVRVILNDLPSAQPDTKAQLPGEGTTFDLISRQAAIDALMEFDKKLRKINWYQYPHTEYECRGVDEAIVKIENVPSAQPEPQWIPCSERLPDTRPVDEIGLFGEKCGEFMLSDPVLGYVCGLDDDVSMAVVWYEDGMDGVTGWTTAPDCMNVNVIAWMPLPEPYREVKWR